MKKILLVEDDPEIVMLLHLHFSLPDYSLAVCSEGKEAIAKAVNDFYDLIILDRSLPDIDGVEVCKTLVSKKLNRPIIMLASGPDIDIVQALGAGADNYIAKPFSMLELQERVKALIRRADQIQMTQTDCGKEGQTDGSAIRKDGKRSNFQGPVNLS
ncbi:MAG: response regulator transcription factor [Williamsia sp.]|nr:response regulator transcription factor [Williamsia sp.]